MGNANSFDRAAPGRQDCSCPHLVMLSVATSSKYSARCHEHSLRGHLPILQRWIPALKPYNFLSTREQSHLAECSAALFSLAQCFQLVPRDGELSHQISIFIRREFLFSQACDRNSPANSSRSSSMANTSKGRGCKSRGRCQVSVYLGMVFQPCARNCEGTNHFGF